MADAEARVTKSLFLSAFVCPTRGWYSRTVEPTAPTAGEQFRRREGQEIGQRARQLFVNGVFAGDVGKTAELLATTDVLFEASFEIDGYIARADILEQRDRGVGLSEVKSSLHNDGEVKPEHIDDMAYTTMVLTRAGIVVDSVELLLLSRDWRLGMPDADLFRRTDHTATVLARAKEFDQVWDLVRDSVCGLERPEPEAIFDCRNCEYFESHCLGNGVSNPIFDIPRISAKRFEELNADGILSIEEIPSDFALTDNQRRVWQCVQDGEPVIDDAALRAHLDSVAWPAGYLDFETFKTALPLWPDIAPHQSIVTQYSLHVCDAPSNEIDHRSYLAESTRDCRRELAEKLLTDTDDLGSVIVYSSYEKTVLTGLGKLFPDLKSDLDDLVTRLFDLEKAFKEGFCHPGFRGRTSIKRTLPVLVPELTYESLEIGEGDSAIAAFARMARNECDSQEEEDGIRQALHSYCEQDTLGMMKLHEALQAVRA